MSGETDFPHVVANHKGHTLTIERSNGLPPHPSPPGYLEVWLRRPDLPDGKPGGHLVSQNICVFAATFDADEEITETQAERNALKGQLAESVKTERALHKEIGKLKARVAELEADLARDRKQVWAELAQVQIAVLERFVPNGGD